MLKRSIWSACAILGMVVATGRPAEAALVTYTTTGVFGCGTIAPTWTCDATTFGTNAIVVNGTALRFNGATFSRVVPPSSNASLGEFETFFGDNSVLDGATFTLTVTQVSPAASGNFTSTLTGRINASANSSAYVLFGAPLSVHLAPFSYSIVSADEGTPGRVNLNPVHETATINGKITYVPEPASAMLLGVALLGFVGVGRRFQLQ